MAGIQSRRDEFEHKFAHDEELRFKVTARRNKLLGLWAAEKLHKNSSDAEAYAKEVVMADFEEVGDEDVFRKVKNDLGAAGIKVTDDEIREQMQLLIETAKAQIFGE